MEPAATSAPDAPGAPVAPSEPTPSAGSVSPGAAPASPSIVPDEFQPSDEHIAWLAAHPDEAHQRLGKHDEWNKAYQRRLTEATLKTERTVRKQTEERYAQQQVVQNAVTSWSGIFARLDREGRFAQTLQQDVTRYDAAGNPSPQGWTPTQWHTWLKTQQDAPQHHAAREIVSAGLFEDLKREWATNPDWQTVVDGWEKLMEAKSLPEFIQQAAEARVAQERKQIPAMVKAEVNKVLARYHMSGEEADLGAPVVESNGEDRYRSLNELQAAHAAGKLSSPKDPLGNTAFRRHARAFGA